MRREYEKGNQGSDFYKVPRGPAHPGPRSRLGQPDGTPQYLMKRVSDLNQSIIRRGWGNEATTERQWVANWPNVNPALLLDQAVQAYSAEGAAGEEAAYPDADGALLGGDADGAGAFAEGYGADGAEGFGGYADADGDLRAAGAHAHLL
eukprot:tig00020801_g13993.t1